MREYPGHLGKGQGHCFVVQGNLTSYTWGWCNAWLTGSQLQFVAGSVLCMRRRCAIVDPGVSSTRHSSRGIRPWSLTQYESPIPVHFSAMASSDIPSEMIWAGKSFCVNL